MLLFSEISVRFAEGLKARTSTQSGIFRNFRIPTGEVSGCSWKVSRGRGANQLHRGLRVSIPLLGGLKMSTYALHHAGKPEV